MNRTMRTRPRTPLSRTRAAALPTLSMPDRIVPMLTAAAFALAGIYIAFMVTAIFFATLQTKLAHSIGETRASIERLESSYYDAIASIDTTDPAALGLVAPARVTYVTAARGTDLTYAGPARP